MKTYSENSRANREYWNGLAGVYQKSTRISTGDFHYGPLLPGDSRLKLLPECIAGLRCLEVGCGAGQNSIFLARHGAVCTAIDISEEQLEHGRTLAAKAGVTVDFCAGCMDDLSQWPDASFDLMHSVYALPFSERPAETVREFARLLRPGGMLVLAVGHPLYAMEWLEVGDDEEGLFVPDYFNPPPDARVSLDDPSLLVQAQYWPVSTVAGWLADAGLLIGRIEEPSAMPVPEMSAEQIAREVPYYSEGWAELYPQLSRVPSVLIFQARKL